MVLDQLSHSDIPVFMDLAAAEGWISSEWELGLLMESFPEGCFAFRVIDQTVAFITSVKYDKSGWIGNLVVKKAMRGKGIGSVLMRKALEVMLRAGVETVWLTASDAGKPIYERVGFAEIGKIIRWKGRGEGGRIRNKREITVEEAIALDSLAWGERRCSLIRGICAGGDVFGAEGGFLVLQGHGALKQIGPWVCTEHNDAPLLLEAALAHAEESREILLDVPEGNFAACALLASKGFTGTGRTSLMFCGVKPLYSQDRIYALGSMGSMG